MKTAQAFQYKLSESNGPWLIGQVLISKNSDSTYSLSHIANDQKPELFHDPVILRKWVNIDEKGEYRPLKGEGNLKPGWKLDALSLDALIFALNVIYPTAIANWLHYDANSLRITPFQETAARQTGMYRVVARQLTDQQLQEVERETCGIKCLKIRLWNGQVVEPKEKQDKQEDHIPLLCPEACNLFVAACRSKIKSKAQ
ncbi:MAG: DR2241 family protein [Verrucomicrobiota bacterium]